MGIFSALLIVVGLILFETVSSIDNAIINAEVLTTMGQKSRRWFLFYGLLISVFLVRGALPFLILWMVNPSLSPLEILTSSFQNNPEIARSLALSSPLLFIGGGMFLTLLFFHWLFLEEKNFGLRGERFIYSKGVWFYAVSSLLLTIIIFVSVQVNPFLALAAAIGSTIFFITHGFSANAERNEQSLLKDPRSDLNKIIYLEIIDAAFSIDGVLGAFAFTLSIPLILVGTGIGAVVVRQLTVGNMNRIQKYPYLENGAMYSVLMLGLVMIIGGFGFKLPEWVSPILTFLIIGYFFYRSRKFLKD